MHGHIDLQVINELLNKVRQVVNFDFPLSNTRHSLPLANAIK